MKFPDGKSRSCNLLDVFLIPQLFYNLLSVFRLQMEKRLNFTKVAVKFLVQG